eukprot:15432386-Alexandrium_andersonii.AAC.1
MGHKELGVSKGARLPPEAHWQHCSRCPREGVVAGGHHARQSPVVFGVILSTSGSVGAAVAAG